MARLALYRHGREEGTKFLSRRKQAGRFGATPGVNPSHIDVLRDAPAGFA
jgi:hypothetical protein